jgi:hypothetical protein
MRFHKPSRDLDPNSTGMPAVRLGSYLPITTVAYWHITAPILRLPYSAS